MEELGLIAIEGTVQAVVFQNPENGYTVLRLRSGGESVTAVGCLPGVAVAAIISMVKTLVLTPIRRHADVEVLAVIRARGEAEGLEQTVKGVQWLRDSGRMETELFIADGGMDVEARRRAEVLALRYGIRIIGLDNMMKDFEDGTWRSLDS